MNFKLLIILVLTFSISCKEKFTPKPHGFFRIEFPDKSYDSLNHRFPYQFEIPEYAKVTPDDENPDQPWWINLEVPENNAQLHISYYNLKKSEKSSRTLLAEFVEESRELAYKHSVKANAIKEQVYLNPSNEVYGILYHIEGNAASPMQFFLTDSTSHFLRGALYIKATPDIDSLKPVIDFLEKDVIHLIETTKWE